MGFDQLIFNSVIRVNNKMSLIFVFKKLSIISLIFSLIIKNSRNKVLITSCEKSFLLKKIKILNSISKNYLYMDFTINHIEPNVLNGDSRGYVKNHINQLFKDEYLLNFMNKYYSKNDKIIHKTKVYLHHYFSPYSLQNKIIYWLEQSEFSNATIFNFTTMRPGENFFWKRSTFRVFNIFCYSRFMISLFLINIQRIVFFPKKFIYGFFKTILNSSITIDKNYVEQDDYKVLFFPHHNFINKKSANPPRDYFYSKDINSQFYPTRIMHLFLDERLDSNQDTPYIQKYLGIDHFQYSLLPSGYSFSVIFRVIKFSINLLFKIKWTERGRLSNQITLLFPMITMYILFEKYKESISQYKEASIALVGYDMLFPATLALALENFKIKTVAVQERFISSFLNAWPYILDVQLTISDCTAAYIKRNNISSIGKLIPVGFIRSDNFFDKVEQFQNKRVIVLDYHVEINDKCQQKFWPVVNWANDIRFREEILFLAEEYPKVEFIFRGKNIDWLESKFHKAVIDRISSLQNVKVDIEYTEKFRSYHLCANADLIIANPTSLAEECASAGMNVIVTDYGINYTQNISEWFPEVMQDYYCHSFEELKEMFATFIQKNYVISKEKKDNIKAEVFSNFSNGKVIERVQDNLKLLYEEINIK